MNNKRILVISDLHAPYMHPDTVAFLAAVKKKHKPTRVILSGDEADFHGISFHDKDSDLDSPGAELDKAIKSLTPLYKMFPKAEVLESNHGSLVLRQALAQGMSRRYFRTPGEILEAPKGWTWHLDITLKLPDGSRCYFHHSKGKPLKTGQLYGMSHVCGHHHESFDIQYWSTPENLHFAMTVSSLVDKKSLALAYCKNNQKRPIVGVGLIIDSHPVLVPMRLSKNGRWTGKI
jgi:hypothetical protein